MGGKRTYLLCSSYSDQVYEPGFTLSVNPELKWLVLAVRGSLSWQDIMTDINVEEEPFKIYYPTAKWFKEREKERNEIAKAEKTAVFPHGYGSRYFDQSLSMEEDHQVDSEIAKLHTVFMVHGGFAKGARYVYNRTRLWIERFYRTHSEKEWRFCCIGHSLGAAVASLVYYMYPSIGHKRLMVYGTPPMLRFCHSEELEEMQTHDDYGDLSTEEADWEVYAGGEDGLLPLQFLYRIPLDDDSRILSVVRGKDWIARLSIRSVDSLMSELAKTSYVSAAVNYVQKSFRKLMENNLENLNNNIGVGGEERGGEQEEGDAAAVIANMASTQAHQNAEISPQSLAAKTRFDRSLKGPGKMVMQLQVRPTHVPPKALWVRNRRNAYGKLLVGVRIFDDHLPNLYLASLCDIYFHGFFERGKLSPQEKVLLRLLKTIQFDYISAYEKANWL